MTPLKQGLHPDPLETAPPVEPSLWPHRQRQALGSSAMEAFREALTLPGQQDVRSSIIDDLSTYYSVPADEAVRRCRGWEAWSVEEWEAAQHSADPLHSFYQSVQSWSFDLLWFAYLQLMGYAYPVSVVIADGLGRPRVGATHLDFGSGIGATSQMFSTLGYRSVLADVSLPLLEFAKFRLARRGLTAETIDLNQRELGEGEYDVITAIDTLVHVKDLERVLPSLHRALRPGGLLFANFTVRPATAENAWHLYEDDLPLRYQLQRAGFEPEETLDGMITRYRRVAATGIVHQVRGVRDRLLLRSPLRPVVRRTRESLRAVTTRSASRAR